MTPRRRANPFYILLAPVGVAFVITAFAYYVMAFQSVAPTRGAAGHQAHPLLKWLRAHGDVAMLAELATLAVLTVAAIATDHLWGKREESQSRQPDAS